jgi:hypothetical protein
LGGGGAGGEDDRVRERPADQSRDPSGPAPAGPVDPVRARRARIAGWVELGQRTGYGLFGLAIVLFGIGFAVRFSGPLTTAIVACLLVGSLVLAPAIVFGYAVKAAEREDRQAGR